MRRMASRVRGARSEVRGKMEEGKINCQLSAKSA